MYEINKIRPKFHFLTKIEIKMAYLVFVLCFFFCLFASRAIWKLFYRRFRFGVVLTIMHLSVKAAQTVEEGVDCTLAKVLSTLII